MRRIGKYGFQQNYGEVNTKTSVRDGNWYAVAKQKDAVTHERHRNYWERQKDAKRKRKRLELMLEMKRLNEL